MYASLNPGLIGIKANFAECLSLAQCHGFGGLDVQIDQLHEAVLRDGAAAVRDLFASHELRPGMWNLPFRPYAVTSAKWRDWLTKLPHLLASAQAVGATRAGMWIMPGSYDRPFEQNFAFHVERFQPLSSLLADYGIRLGIEFIGPETMLRMFKFPFIRSIAQTRELAHAIGPNCGQLLDAYHWYCAGGIGADLQGLTQDEIVGVHLNDAPAGVERAAQLDGVRKLPGATGVVDLTMFIQALDDVRYAGPVTAEPFDIELSALPADESASRTARSLLASIGTIRCSP